MPYHFQTDQIKENMFLLQMICGGTENYCADLGIHREADDPEFKWEEYVAYTKGILSRMVIETSISCRMIADLVDKNYEELQVRSKDLLAEALGEESLGYVLQGEIELTLRESFNKIIHATEMTLAYDSQCGENGDYQTWNGVIELEGEHKKDDWLIGIAVYPWSQCVRRYVDLLDDRIDWIHFYKYDF